MDTVSVCILPKLRGPGGPSSFQSKLIKGLDALGIAVHHNPHQTDTQVILVNGATRAIDELLSAKRRGVRIVQRLDGMNWLHKKRFTSIPHFVRSEMMNILLAFTRRWISDRIIYQSGFTRDWWNTVYGSVKKPVKVIHNGVDLDQFHPQGNGLPPKDFFRILVVEGSFKGGHERDLFNAVEAANMLSESLGQMVELMVVGNAPEKMRAKTAFNKKSTVRWMGVVPHKDIPKLDRSAHILFPAEINAACPNSVVEAMACGLPVVSYATGSLPELVGDEGGIIVPYGADYWKLEPPVTEGLVNAVKKVLDNLPAYRTKARKRAEQMFGLEKMVADYQQVFFE